MIVKIQGPACRRLLLLQGKRDNFNTITAALLFFQQQPDVPLRAAAAVRRRLRRAHLHFAAAD
jgi:hypothetical protein